MHSHNELAIVHVSQGSEIVNQSSSTADFLGRGDQLCPEISGELCGGLLPQTRARSP